MTVKKTGKKSFSHGTYHPAGAFIYLSGIPFLPLKMSCHDDFNLLKPGRFQCVS